MSLLLAGPELDLRLDLALFPARALHWITPQDEGGVRNVEHLRELIGLIGSDQGREWLVVDSDLGIYAQSCGNQRGLAVEIGFDDHPHLVAPLAARSWPRVDVGVGAWQYLAHPTELHTPSATFGLFADWLYDRVFSPGFELRSIEDRDCRWLW
ncbi:hypothetical protein [Protaetiibacter intestinalis]|uniref:Uncharacterized protein n=1 Tax=Protaetiibacter intestinalis TaxID=2419774 RepID=A0A387B452_9MICO|nr:hypothetical protein [Protaetiibacter intestinalis]AYF97193.1 hypothetical protein D7I47_02305 [Protaetiibacter intestinalis]